MSYLSSYLQSMPTVSQPIVKMDRCCQNEIRCILYIEITGSGTLDKAVSIACYMAIWKSMWLHGWCYHRLRSFWHTKGWLAWHAKGRLDLWSNHRLSTSQFLSPCTEWQTAFIRCKNKWLRNSCVLFSSFTVPQVQALWPLTTRLNKQW